MLVDFVLSPPSRLVFQISIETLNNIPSTVRRSFRKIRRFKVVNLDFNLGL